MGCRLRTGRHRTDRIHNTVRDVAWSPDGPRLAACSRDRCIRLFGTASWQQAAELSGRRNEIYRLAWFPDGTRLVSAAYDRTCIVWDMETGRPQQVLERSNNHATPVSWTPDGKCLVSAVDHRIRVLDSRTGQVRQTFPESNELVTDLCCSPRGGSFVVSSRGPEVQVRSLDGGGELVRLRGHTNRVQASPGPRTELASPSPNATRMPPCWTSRPAQISDSTESTPSESARWRGHRPGRCRRPVRTTTRRKSGMCRITVSCTV
ncbi:WD40 repeat domain-containing protein [Streptomyces sp. CA-249302]|uniref:WD40 repeat domain-containing protein n=1 Tax=Streptomyces sp. CA-249302 TaxID=3240058 RepID=UPI003D94EF33